MAALAAVAALVLVLGSRRSGNAGRRRLGRARARPRARALRRRVPRRARAGAADPDAAAAAPRTRPPAPARRALDRARAGPGGGRVGVPRRQRRARGLRAALPDDAPQRDRRPGVVQRPPTSSSSSRSDGGLSTPLGRAARALPLARAGNDAVPVLREQGSVRRRGLPTGDDPRRAGRGAAGPRRVARRLLGHADWTDREAARAGGEAGAAGVAVPRDATELSLKVRVAGDDVAIVGAFVGERRPLLSADFGRTRGRPGRARVPVRGQARRRAAARPALRPRGRGRGPRARRRPGAARA